MGANKKTLWIILAVVVVAIVALWLAGPTLMQGKLQFRFNRFMGPNMQVCSNVISRVTSQPCSNVTTGITTKVCSNVTSQVPSKVCGKKQ